MTAEPNVDVAALTPAVVGPGALAGLRVLDIATMMAGPWAATYLADYGADVVKVEMPRTGDPVRHWGSKDDGISLAWKGLARNKRLITLAMNKPAGQQLLLRMVAGFDVLVENFRPGVLERWGLGPDRLHEANPRLIILRTSGYGQTGPLGPKPGFGTLAEAFSGLAFITGAEDRPPVLTGYPLADGVAALAGAMAILAAVYHRDVNGGQGQVIDNAITEANYRLIEHLSLEYERLGTVRSRSGSRIGDLAPRNTYETADGRWVAISGGTQSVVDRLFRAMGRPELIDDPRFRTNAERIRNVIELDDAISAWMINLELTEVLQSFEDFEVAGAPVNDVSQIATDEHFRARDLRVSIDDPDLGLTSAAQVHPRLSVTPGGVGHLGGPIGRDTDAFYRDEIGLSTAELTELRELGVI